MDSDERRYFNERRLENVQTLLTIPEKARLTKMAQAEDRTVSDLVRVFVLESLKAWEGSAAGRKRRAK